jgi:hypothetical protein
MNSTAAASLMCPSPGYFVSCAIASVRIGRRRLPPELIRWFATSGIIVTSEPVRVRIVELTRCMSALTNSERPSIEGAGWLPNGTITANEISTFQCDV